MKKSLFTFLSICLVTSYAAFGGSNTSSLLTNEVEPMFFEGDKVISVGLGLGTTLYSGRYYNTKVPPVSVSFELGVEDDFLTEDMTLGVGGYVGYASSEYKWRHANWGWNYTYIVVGGRGALHYPIVENIDTYAGVMMGLNIVLSSEFGDGAGDISASGSGLIYGLYGGARYYFSEDIAFMAELGYGIAYLTIGISLKLP